MSGLKPRPYLAVLVVTIALLGAACGGGGSGGSGGGAGSTGSFGQVAWLYVGDVADADYNATHHQAMQALAKEFGFTPVFQDNVSIADLERLATQDIARGAKTVVLTSSSWFTNVMELARKYPDVQFIGFIGSPKPPADAPKNLWLLGLNFHDAEYLLGVLAGLKTKTGNVAWIGGLKIPGLIAGANAYFAGACSVNDKVRLSNLVVGSFDDASLARNAAASLIRRDVDVIMSHLNGGVPGVPDAINSSGKPVYWTGLYTDKRSLDPSHYLGSVAIDFHSAYQKVFGELKAGKTSGFMDLAKDIDLTTLYNVDDATRAKTEQALKQIVAGSVQVPVESTQLKPTCDT